jgi:hypothetical protein
MERTTVEMLLKQVSEGNINLASENSNTGESNAPASWSWSETQNKSWNEQSWNEQSWSK